MFFAKGDWQSLSFEVTQKQTTQSMKNNGDKKTEVIAQFNTLLYVWTVSTTMDSEASTLAEAVNRACLWK